MKVICFWAVFAYWFCQGMQAHTSALVSIQNTTGTPVASTASGSSRMLPTAGGVKICYNKGDNNVGQLPRCHSEVDLLRNIVASTPATSLNGCRISIKNSAYYPCRTPFGNTYYGGTVETNRGITCDALLRSCNTAEGAFQTCFGFLCASIRVTYPGNATTYPAGTTDS